MALGLHVRARIGANRAQARVAVDVFVDELLLGGHEAEQRVVGGQVREIVLRARFREIARAREAGLELARLGDRRIGAREAGRRGGACSHEHGVAIGGGKPRARIGGGRGGIDVDLAIRSGERLGGGAREGVVVHGRLEFRDLAERRLREHLHIGQIDAFQHLAYLLVGGFKRRARVAEVDEGHFHGRESEGFGAEDRLDDELHVHFEPPKGAEEMLLIECAAVVFEVQRDRVVAPHGQAECIGAPHAHGYARLGREDIDVLLGGAIGAMVVPLEVLEPCIERDPGRKIALHEELPIEGQVYAEAEEEGNSDPYAAIEAAFEEKDSVEREFAPIVVCIPAVPQTQGRKLALRGYGFGYGRGAAEGISLAQAGIRLLARCQIVA